MAAERTLGTLEKYAKLSDEALGKLERINITDKFVKEGDPTFSEDSAKVDQLQTLLTRLLRMPNLELKELEMKHFPGSSRRTKVSVALGLLQAKGVSLSGDDIGGRDINMPARPWNNLLSVWNKSLKGDKSSKGMMKEKTIKDLLQKGEITDLLSQVSWESGSPFGRIANISLYDQQPEYYQRPEKQLDRVKQDFLEVHRAGRIGEIFSEIDQLLQEGKPIDPKSAESVEAKISEISKKISSLNLTEEERDVQGKLSKCVGELRENLKARSATYSAIYKAGEIGEIQHEIAQLLKAKGPIDSEFAKSKAKIFEKICNLNLTEDESDIQVKLSTSFLELEVKLVARLAEESSVSTEGVGGGPSSISEDETTSGPSATPHKHSKELEPSVSPEGAEGPSRSDSEKRGSAAVAPVKEKAPASSGVALKLAGWLRSGLGPEHSSINGEPSSPKSQ